MLNHLHIPCSGCWINQSTHLQAMYKNKFRVTTLNWNEVWSQASPQTFTLSPSPIIYLRPCFNNSLAYTILLHTKDTPFLTLASRNPTCAWYLARRILATIEFSLLISLQPCFANNAKLPPIPEILILYLFLISTCSLIFLINTPTLSIFTPLNFPNHTSNLITNPFWDQKTLHVIHRNYLNDRFYKLGKKIFSFQPLIFFHTLSLIYWKFCFLDRPTKYVIPNYYSCHISPSLKSPQYAYIV